jgi:hypothetical protein
MTIRSRYSTQTRKLVSSRFGLACSVAGTTLAIALGLCAPALAAEVTYERLLNAAKEPQNWLMRMGNYGNWNNSSLKEINRDNVKDLKVKFMFSLGDPSRPNKATQYFTPIVEDGFMYVANQWQQYWKLDVRDGKAKVVWKFDAKVQGGGNSPHSVALLGNNVYLNTGKDAPNPRLIALDKNSGEVVFDVATTNPDVLPNQGHSAAPLAVKDKILIGVPIAARTAAAMSPPTAPTPASCCGASWLCLTRASPGPKAGPTHAPFPPAAAVSGPSRPTIRPPISPISAPPIQCTCFFLKTGPPTRSTPTPSSLSSRYRRAEMALPDGAERVMGLRRGGDHAAHRHPHQRRDAQGHLADQPQRLLLRARPRQWPVPAWQALHQCQLDPRP